MQTPPTYNIYLFSLVWKQMLEEGGVPNFEKRAIYRASRIYSIIDNSNGFYVNNVQPSDRSRMSIIFRIKNGNTEMEQLYLRYS